MHRLLMVVILMSWICGSMAQTNSSCIVDPNLSQRKDWTYLDGFDRAWLSGKVPPAKAKPIEPAKQLEELPDIRPAQLYTLFLTLQVRDSCTVDQYLCVEQAVASLVYLDGALIAQFGDLNQHPGGTRAFDPTNRPVLLPSLSPGSHQLMVVLSLQESLRPRSMFGRIFPLFDGKILSHTRAMDVYANRWASGMEYMNSGIFLLLFLVHFLSFLVNPASKLQGWFCLFALASILMGIPGIVAHDSNWVDLKIRSIVFITFLRIFSFIFLSISYLEILKPVSWRWSIPIIASAILASLNDWFTPSQFRQPFNLILESIGPALMAILAYRKIREGNPSARYLFWGTMLYLSSWIAFLFLLSFEAPPIVNDIIFKLSVLSIPLSISMVLSQQFRFTNLALKKETIEKEKLAHEKEQLLEDENQKLEAEVADRTADLLSKNRELEIESAMDKIRSRSLSMQQSDEIRDVIAVMFAQLNELGVHCTTIAIQLFDFQTMHSVFWPGNPLRSKAPKVMLPYDESLMNEDSYYRDLWEAMKDGRIIFNKVYTGKQKDRWFDYVFAHNDTSVIEEHTRQFIRNAEKNIVCFAPEKHSALFADTWDGSLFSEEDLEVFKRAARVFDQAYIRFQDLQKAEQQTHQANIETALERVRARALAMQAPEELVEVAKLLRQEMGNLGVESLETSTVFIHDEGSDLAECWFAIRDGRLPDKPLVSDHISLNLQETWVGKQMMDFYNSETIKTSIPMRGHHRREWIEYCYQRSPVLNGYYGHHIPDRQYHLYKFSNGAIGAAAPGAISEESWELLQRTASVFSLAYSRFKDLSQARIDLQKLKEEKQRAETALTELKSTQAQLVQSEKMASLGELTAGIAHEIQNPLNFVNNFSDLNQELIDELKEELNKGDVKEAVIIADNLKENESKINLHGRRADSIVKSMLQHSRSSSGQKESTDLNKLVDEYTRLAYQGFRARYKDFNVKLDIDLDPSLPRIPVVAQDIGRVILNLLNNAFQAVQEKAQTAEAGYQPIVSIQTYFPEGDPGLRSIRNPELANEPMSKSVIVRVADNGPGIPENIKEKIFQPFFTTKPTGQGTGLGLSLSYDIVKAHGGKIFAESRKEMGSNFKVLLPI